MGTKQVIVIRKDLKMRRGKECAQVAHASMAWLTTRIQKLYAGQIGHKYFEEDGPLHNPLELSPAEYDWVTGIFAKVVCQVDSLEALTEVYEKAKAKGLEAHLITDVGKTEFKGIPTPTAVGIGPDEEKKIDAVTSELKLY